MHQTTTVPCSTLDYFPTVLDALEIDAKSHPEPLDGVSLLPLIDDAMPERPHPIAFEFREKIALIDNRYKLISVNSGQDYSLYDLQADPGEKNNLAEAHPEIVAAMKQRLESWRNSCRGSRQGKDYQ